MPDSSAAEPNGASPSSTGPAGAHFEGQVGAHYLLTMLAGAEPRGFPGMSIERVEFQRAGEQKPLDDVVVVGVQGTGEPAELEVQVKRTITFAPRDSVFESVVQQLAKAYQTLDLSNERHQFAVATAHTSFKITGPYRDVLQWAREIGSASLFVERINRKGVGNDHMRTFVETVRRHLEHAGSTNDDDTVWQILRRFQILTFDYSSAGSQSLNLALERAGRVLAAPDRSRANAFWSVLTETAIRSAAAGGDLNRTKLQDEVTRTHGFRLCGLPVYSAPRQALGDAAKLAAADLRPRIAGITLARSAQLDRIRDALDQGRYVEIRGDPGVGKSGLLGMILDQVLAECRAIVLTPDRTLPGGWLALKSALRIEGTADAFLTDLASDGGAVLFIDSLDSFQDRDKQATVVDLVRAAATVPAIQIIATARTDFAKDDPHWLPSDVLAQLRRAPTVVIDELGPEEVEELKAAAPALRALLGDNHPARAVARNLFRLSRLLEVEGPTEQLRSEVDLLDRWYNTADGPEPSRRERARLLADLADAMLAGKDHLETRSSAVESLIKSGTLRELRRDQIVFRHDVLRDWSVAARLHEVPDKLDQLPLDRTAPASLARGVELGARFALERSADGASWLDYLDGVSRQGSHPSWRRWSLLAILRSERHSRLLDQASAVLMQNEGALLQELIRTTLAVESRNLVEMLAEHGAKIEGFPADFYAPANSSWVRLTAWLLQNRANLPRGAIRDVIELFQNLFVSTFSAAPIAPQMALAVADWLDEIEDVQDGYRLAVDKLKFARDIYYYDFVKLKAVVRQAFLLMAASVPDRAQGYLRRLLRREGDRTIGEIMKFRGTLAQAAPAELTELTLAGLLPKGPKRRWSLALNEVFNDLDSDFLPTSPAQGPFLDLLCASPEHGLDLLRRLVDHAVAVKSGGLDPDDNGLTLALPTGPRFFAWTQSYFWSRSADGCYAIESGLRALEAWAHERIESGDPPEQVIGDVLGPAGSPAAFLLVVVDILISHWPKTGAAVIPFLGSPELLSLDRDRLLHDQMPEIDLLGLGAIGPSEPTGRARNADLQRRLSRRWALEALLASFAVDETADRGTLQAILGEASTRLGPPQPQDTFAEPRFMARHALNLIDPGNWQETEHGLAYVSPPVELQHLERLQAQRITAEQEMGVQAYIRAVLENPGRASPPMLEQAVDYAKRATTNTTLESARHLWINAIVPAAMLVARDGTDALLHEHEDWVRQVFAQACASTETSRISYSRDGIQFNEVAIAALGIVHLWRRHLRDGDRRTLFELASRDDPCAAQGFGAGLSVLRDTNCRLVPALLRCALVAQIQPKHLRNDPDERRATNQARHRFAVSKAIESELAWLRGAGPQPAWPSLPPRMISVRRGLRLGDVGHAAPERAERPHAEFRFQSAALWAQQLTRGFTAPDLSWMDDFVKVYADWTVEANGGRLGPDAEIDSLIDDWNSAFLPLLASSITRMPPEEAVCHVSRLAAVPDISFFEIARELVRAIDWVHFNGLGLKQDLALRLRVLLVDRMIQSSGWRSERDRSSLQIEIRIGPAIAALFFNHHSIVNPSYCYLTEKGIDHVGPFLPQLLRLIDDGPVPFTAILTMNLVEVAPRAAHAAFLLASALTWLDRQPSNTRLWVDAGVGARVARFVETIVGMDPALRMSVHPLRPQIDTVLARLVQVGVAEAHRVEALLAGSAS